MQEIVFPSAVCNGVVLHSKLDPDFHIAHEFPRGYPSLADLLSNDEMFLIFRKYGYLRNRLLLNLQDQIAVLESDLHLLDHREAQTHPNALRSRTIDEERGEGCVRRTLLEKIGEKLKIYGEFPILVKSLLQERSQNLT